MSEAATNPPTRLAVVVNNLTPYRIHAHTRFKREIPGLSIRTYVAWDATRNLWVYTPETMPDIGVVTYDGAAAERQHGSLTYYIRDWATGGKICRDLRAARPDVVIANGYGYPSLMRVLLWCRFHRVPCLLWSDSNLHSDNALGVRRFLKRLIVPLVLRLVDALLVCGSNGLNYYTRYGARRERMFFAPIEPDYQLIAATPPDVRDAMARAYNLAPNRRRLLVCARLVPVKAVDQAIDAFAAVAYKRPDLDLVIMGDGPLRARLQARVPSTLRERVIFTGFHDQQQKVNALYSLCDVLVHPATWEPWGVVLLEAAAAGLALVTTSVVGAAPELVHDGVNGRVVPPNDRVALARAILDVTQPSNLADFKAASIRVSQRFRAVLDPVRGVSDAMHHLRVTLPREPRTHAGPPEFPKQTRTD